MRRTEPLEPAPMLTRVSTPASPETEDNPWISDQGVDYFIKRIKDKDLHVRSQANKTSNGNITFAESGTNLMEDSGEIYKSP